MAQVIMDHPGAWCFGTSLAPFMARLGHIDHALPFGGDSFICSYSISRRSGSRTQSGIWIIAVSPARKNASSPLTSPRKRGAYGRKGLCGGSLLELFDLPLHDGSHFAPTGSGIADEW